MCACVCGDAGVWAERGRVLLRLSASRCLQAQGPNGHQPRCEHSVQHTHAAASSLPTAAIVFFPILIMFSMGLSILGGWISLIASGLSSTDSYVFGLRSFFKVSDITYALSKTVVFGFLIVSISSFYGYYTRGGALDVGKSSTQAVVSSSIAILLANFFITQMFLLK